jgi:hypothetical protein
LVEVVVSLAIGATVFAGILLAYAQSAERAEWSAYSQAAHSLALQRLEQARSARWDRLSYPPVDELVSNNFPLQVEVLDIPVSGGRFTYATNHTTIGTVSTDPPLRFIQVDCVWSFLDRGLFTNTITTYRAPDQ